MDGPVLLSPILAGIYLTYLILKFIYAIIIYKTDKSIWIDTRYISAMRKHEKWLEQVTLTGAVFGLFFGTLFGLTNKMYSSQGDGALTFSEHLSNSMLFLGGPACIVSLVVFIIVRCILSMVFSNTWPPYVYKVMVDRKMHKKDGIKNDILRKYGVDATLELMDEYVELQRIKEELRKMEKQIYVDPYEGTSDYVGQTLDLIDNPAIPEAKARINQLESKFKELKNKSVNHE